MPWIEPFRGLRYNPGKVGDLSRVVTPPYDVISPQAQQGYYRRHRYNFIRVVYGRQYAGDRQGHDRYSRARRTLEGWIRQGILREDRVPSVYPYQQEYRVGGAAHRRWGVIALLRLSSRVLPHEEIRPQPKLDRLHLLEALGLSSSQIFGLVPDPAGRFRKAVASWCRRHRAASTVAVDGVKHRLWRVSDPRWVSGLQRLLRRREVVIADGHHRYAASRAYREKQRRKAGRPARPQPYDYALFFLSAAAGEEPGLLPTHRVLRGAARSRMAAFRSRLERNGRATTRLGSVERRDGVEELLGELRRLRRAGKVAVGCCSGKGHTWILRMPPAAGYPLDVEWLHRQVLPEWIGGKQELSYTQDAREGLRQLRGGAAQALLLMQPPRLAEVLRRARAGRRMPGKTTYFYPKTLSGLVEYRLEGG